MPLRLWDTRAVRPLGGCWGLLGAPGPPRFRPQGQGGTLRANLRATVHTGPGSFLRHCDPRSDTRPYSAQPLTKQPRYLQFGSPEMARFRRNGSVPPVSSTSWWRGLLISQTRREGWFPLWALPTAPGVLAAGRRRVPQEAGPRNCTRSGKARLLYALMPRTFPCLLVPFSALFQRETWGRQSRAVGAHREASGEERAADILRGGPQPRLQAAALRPPGPERTRRVPSEDEDPAAQRVGSSKLGQTGLGERQVDGLTGWTRSDSSDPCRPETVRCRQTTRRGVPANRCRQHRRATQRARGKSSHGGEGGAVVAQRGSLTARPDQPLLRPQASSVSESPGHCPQHNPSTDQPELVARGPRHKPASRESAAIRPQGN